MGYYEDNNSPRSPLTLRGEEWEQDKGLKFGTVDSRIKAENAVKQKPIPPQYHQPSAELRGKPIAPFASPSLTLPTRLPDGQARGRETDKLKEIDRKLEELKRKAHRGKHP